VPVVPAVKSDAVVGLGDDVDGIGSLTNDASDTRDDAVVAVYDLVAANVSAKV
jgi:hypothetical protein